MIGRIITRILLRASLLLAAALAVGLFFWVVANDGGVQ